MAEYMKSPCKRCPFRIDVVPYLHPERAKEIAYAASNPYRTFACHKTTEYDEDVEDQVATENSKECAGFLTMRAVEDDSNLPKGFKPSYKLCYENEWHMVDAYQEQWDKEYK